jgi:hypothetical protein
MSLGAGKALDELPELGIGAVQFTPLLREELYNKRPKCIALMAEGQHVTEDEELVEGSMLEQMAILRTV